MGPATQIVATGFTGVSSADSYPTGVGSQYGWSTAPSYDFGRSAFEYIPSNLDPAFYLDGVTAISPFSFKADVSNGNYRVVLYLGDPVDTKDASATALDRMRMRMRIWLEGVELADDIWARTLAMKAQTVNPLGGHRRVHLRTSVTDGVLDLDLVPIGGHTRASILALEIYPDQAEPLRFNVSSSALEPDVAFGADFDLFLAEMGVANYAAAETEALAIGNDLAKAYATCWLAGWMSGEEADLNVPLIQAARAALVAFNSPDDVRAAILLAEIDDVLLAKQFNDARGYSQSLVPISLPDPSDPNKVSITANLSAAVMLFEQVQSDLYGPLAAGQPQSPLFPRAQFLLARNHHSRNTKQQGNILAEFNTYWMGVMEELGSLHTTHGIYPEADALEVFSFMVTNYPQSGAIFVNWDSISTPTFDPAGSWWGPLVEYADNANAPSWANLQRKYYQAYRRTSDWWMNNRLIGNEIGGGDGDDVEGGALLGVPSALLSEPNNVGDQGAGAVLEAVVFGPKVSQTEGYYKESCADVEHNAEFTTNPLWLLLPASFGNPKHWEFAHLTMRNFAHQGVNSWSTVTGAGYRQFKTYKYDAFNICGPDDEDVPLNVRAIIPGFNLIDYSGHPSVVDLFEQLADSWTDHLLSTADGKPLGVFPASVDHSNPPSFSDGGGWWKASDSGYGLELLPIPKTRNQSYLYSLARSMYLNSDDSNRSRFLRPMLEGTRFLEDFHNGQLVGMNPGDDLWAATLLQGVIGNAVAGSRPFFDDAGVQSDLGVTAADLSAMDNIVIPNYAGSWQNFLLDTSVPKDKTLLESDLGNAVRWMRYFFPLATTSVAYSDRIHVFTGQNDPSAQFSMHVMYQAMLGGSWGVLPSYPVSWANPNPVQELDVAILVLKSEEERFEALLFNFGSTASDIGARFWRGLRPGKYDITLGSDSDFDDQIDPGTGVLLEDDYPLETKGAQYNFSLPAGALKKLEVVFEPGTGSSFQLLEDLALGDGDLVYNRGAGTLSITVHNLGAMRATGATLDIFEDGQPYMMGIPLPAISAPLNLTPSSVTLTGPFAPSSGTIAVTATVQPAPGKAEITTLNNSVTERL